ncbi:MAG: putative DNA binding domain-containing protein [Betaproteobacteria bacterium AqS2]|uniref:DNA binding domain-containing protein n=1 Tax=Candidatus Amphirhobacter heronislandensis TaxID=1732024 RepID=A0A930UHS5_9GAMM|nr:putative DNA binding domain-containing protein [Betaproteobacteria bacterium AqS2]
MLAGKDITVEKIDELLKELASSCLTFNEGRNGYSTHRLCKRCAAMANAGGGLMLLGVTAKMPHKVVGSQAYRDPARLEKLVASRLRPTIRVEIVPVEHPQGRVMCVIVPSANAEPVRYKHVWYTRIGAQTVCMPLHEIAHLLGSGKRIAWLDDVCMRNLTAEAALDLLDVEAFCRITEGKPCTEPDLALEALKRSEMLVPDQDGSGFSITRASALLLARCMERFPAEIAWKRVRMVKYEGKTRKSAVLFDQRLDRGYASGLDAMMEMAAGRGSGSRNGARSGGAGSWYRKALRELLINAIVHQDFDSSEEVVLEVFADRVEIANPGESLTSPDYMISHYRSRNPQLMYAMMDLGLASDLGRGLCIVVDALEENCAAPLEIESKGGFTRARLFFGRRAYGDMSKSHKKGALYQHCLLKRANHQVATQASARARFNLGAKRQDELPRLLNELVAEGKLKYSYEYRNSRRYKLYYPHRA